MKRKPLFKELKDQEPSWGKKKPKKAKKEEKKLSYMVAEYVSLQYPRVIFRFDVAADLRMTTGQSNIIKSKLLHKRGFHDLTLFEPRGDYFGLCIELKKNKSEVFTIDGNLKKKKISGTQLDHNKLQAEHLGNMRLKGYKAEYGFGFDYTKSLIDNYMKLQPNY